MKIALVILHADAARGGAERYTFNLATSLAARGHTVTLIASSIPPKLTGPFDRVELDAVGMTRTRRYARFLDRLDQHLSVAHYDIVHAMLPVRRCDVYHPHAGLALAAVRSEATSFRKRFSNLINPRRWAMAQVESQLLGSSKRPIVLALSDYVKRSIRATYPELQDAGVHTLFNAVDLNAFDPTVAIEARQRTRQDLELGDQDIAALFIGQDLVRKGVRQALAALDQVDDPRLKLIVVGGDKAQYARRVARQGRSSRVRFVGSQPRTLPYYAAADLFVLPTRHDPCSLVVLEALAMGVPVISTRFNGACEVMTAEHGFVLHDPADINALANAMRALLDPATRRAMSHAALALRPALSNEAHLDRLLAIYDRAQDRG